MSGKYHSEWLLIISLVCFVADARKSLPAAFVSQFIINTESFTQYITHTSGSLKIGLNKRRYTSVVLRMLRCPDENPYYLSASEYYDL